MESNAFKEGIDENAVRRIARCIRLVAPEFPNRKFINIAARGLVELELKARVSHVIAALRICLPDDPIEAIGILVETGSRWDPGDENDPAVTREGQLLIHQSSMNRVGLVQILLPTVD